MEYFYAIVNILAGCGSFLLGFKLLSDNMEKLFGGSLKKLFNKTSEKKWVGVGMGAVSTAVVQSSGVTTVMVVGFVNAGIMSLYQAATVIMGANIGTTITAQLAAFSSFDIAPFFISLLFIGVMMDMVCSKDKLKSIGLAIAGLGIVFFGLEVMSDAMSPYKSHPAVQNLLASLSNPFLLLAFGIIFTALLQSSSAVTTIIIAMASQGLLIGGGGNAVLFIILGSNIGSCVTALISSIGTSVNARRASTIHLLFNITGTILFTIMLLIWKDFYTTTFVKWFTQPTTQIAMFHTFFNTVCTLLFLPFTRVLVRLAQAIVPERKNVTSEFAMTYMDKRFLATPALAIGQLTKETFRMADMAMQSLTCAFNGFTERAPEKKEEVFATNKQVAKLSEGISDYLVQVSASSISLSDEKFVNALHNAVGDIVRVAEIADNFTKYTDKEVEESLEFSPVVGEKITEMYARIQEQYELVKRIVLDGERRLIEQSDAVEEKIDDMRRALISDHIARMSRGECRPENNAVFINLVSNLERVGDHLNYIAHSVENL